MHKTESAEHVCEHIPHLPANPSHSTPTPPHPTPSQTCAPELLSNTAAVFIPTTPPAAASVFTPSATLITKNQGASQLVINNNSTTEPMSLSSALVSNCPPALKRHSNMALASVAENAAIKADKGSNGSSAGPALPGHCYLKLGWPRNHSSPGLRNRVFFDLQCSWGPLFMFLVW